MQSVASFGWELINLNGNGADAYFRVATPMVLNSFNIDASLMLVSGTSGGWAEVLCQGRVNRGAAPVFSGSAAYLPFPASQDFGSLTWYNPAGLNLVGDSSLSQDLFYSVILKTFIPADGTGSSTYRQVAGQPALQLNAGDYLAFHMDHAGVSVDCELQIVLFYTPT